MLGRVDIGADEFNPFEKEIAPGIFEHSGSPVIQSIPGASIQGKPSIPKEALSNLPIVIQCILHYWDIS
jgi:hypothetical protein